MLFERVAYDDYRVDTFDQTAYVFAYMLVCHNILVEFLEAGVKVEKQFFVLERFATIGDSRTALLAVLYVLERFAVVHHYL